MTFSSEPQVLLYGDSHSEAVYQAGELRQRKRIPTPICIHRARRQKGEIILGDTSLEEFVGLTRELTANDVVISMIGGNQHAVFSTIQHPIKFDVLEPGEEPNALRPGAQLVPYRAIASMLHSGIRGRDGRSLTAVRESTGAKMVHVMPPPPKRDSEFIRSYHESRFKDEIAKLGVSTPELRMKIWRIQQNILRDFCVELGIELLDPPTNALDSDGFLLPEYYAMDATHANRAYGMLILEHLERRFLSDAKVVA
jgi:hypothetical protein